MVNKIMQAGQIICGVAFDSEVPMGATAGQSGVGSPGFPVSQSGLECPSPTDPLSMLGMM